MPLFSAGKAGRQQRLDKLLFMGTYNFPWLRMRLQDGDNFPPVSSIQGSSGTITDLSVSPSGTLVVMAHFFSPFFSLAKRSGGTLTTVAPLGAYTQPTDHANACAVSGTGAFMAVGSRTGQRLHVYKVTESAQSVTLSDVPVSGELPPGRVFNICFSFDDTYLAVASNPLDGQIGQGLLRIYKKQTGDAYSFLTSLPVGNAGSTTMCTFDATATYLVTGSNPNNANQIFVFKRTGDSFSQIANLEPTQNNRQVFSSSFTKDGQYLSIGFGLNNDGPYSGESFVWYKRSGDSFTKLPTPANMFSNQSRLNNMAWSDDGLYLAVGQYFNSSESANGLTVFKRSGDTLTALPFTNDTEVGGVAFFPGAVPGSV